MSSKVKFSKLRSELSVKIEVQNVEFGTAEWSFQDMDAKFSHSNTTLLKNAFDATTNGDDQNSLILENCHLGQLRTAQTGMIRIENCSVLDSGGDGSEAYIAVFHSNITITNLLVSRFHGDTFLRVIKGKAKLSHATFINSSVSFSMMEVTNNSLVSINQSKCIGNSGSAITIDNNSSALIDASTFESNTASDSDCLSCHDLVMCYHHSSLVVRTSVFIGNRKFTTAGIGIQSSSAGIINYSKFFNNSGEIGGAVSAKLQSFLQVSNCWFRDNQVAVSGGAIYVETSPGVVVLNSAFVNNSAGALGGAVVVGLDPAPDFLSGSGFVGTYFRSGAHEISNCSFEGNVAPQGGALFLRNVSVVIRQTAFVNNAAVDPSCPLNLGGAIRIESSTVNLTECHLKRNVARNSGGGVHAEHSRLFFKFSSAMQNQVQSAQSGVGGALSIFDTMMVVEHSVFETNIATRGGAIINTYSEVPASSHIQNSTFTRNLAFAGGAIFCDSTQIIDSQFSGNHGSEGGALNINSNTEVNISGSRFEANSAQTGGAVYARLNVSLVLSFCSFRANWIRSR